MPLQPYADGGLFLLMKGRQLKHTRQLEEAAATFENAISCQKGWRQLSHMCQYELGWTYFYLGDYAKALAPFTLMLKTNKWSKVFFAYMCAQCAITQGQLEKAEEVCVPIFFFCFFVTSFVIVVQFLKQLEGLTVNKVGCVIFLYLN
jgi:tetratricopeptide (TPR) repeat protein